LPVKRTASIYKATPTSGSTTSGKDPGTIGCQRRWLSCCAGGKEWQRKEWEGEGSDRGRCIRPPARTAVPSARSPSSQPLEDLSTAGRAGRNTEGEGSELVAGSNIPEGIEGYGTLVIWCLPHVRKSRPERAISGKFEMRSQISPESRI
jgi:hypothetical protein